MNEALQSAIEQAWERRDSIGTGTWDESRTAVDAALAALDSGEARIAEKVGGEWIVHQWLKKAVLLSFRLAPMEMIPGGPGMSHWWDKVPSKFAGWSEKQFEAAGFRAVPGAIVRRGAYVAPGAVLMPSFVNIGARVGEGTMVDTWATVGGRRAGRSAVDGRLHRRLDEDRRPRDRPDSLRSRAGLLGGRPGNTSRQGRQTLASLRRDRQTGGRAHPVENKHQRAAPRLTPRQNCL